jgi:multidrug transporter EmrE-like cation transporter
MSMILLLCAVLAEVAGTTLLKLSQGLTKLVPSLLMIPLLRSKLPVSFIGSQTS